MSEDRHLAAEEQGRREMQELWQRWAPARDGLARATRDAVDDIRIKLVEEGWSGRAQTEPVRAWARPEVEQPQSMDFQKEWAAVYGDDGRKPDQNPPATGEPEKEGPER